jgi:ribose 5-phosphate isomerase A
LSFMRWQNPLLSDYKWCREISNLERKKILGQKIAMYAADGQIIGVGTGSSAFVALKELAARAREERLSIKIIPAAKEIEMACASLGLPITTLVAGKPDWCFDGADEIGPNGDVIKGRGGGLFMEKLIINACDRRYLLADESKYVSKIGKRPIPVEVYPDAIHIAEKALTRLGATEISLRLAVSKDGPVITEAGNILLDCRFDNIRDGLERDIKQIPGVIESGLFQGYGFEFVRI